MFLTDSCPSLTLLESSWPCHRRQEQSRRRQRYVIQAAWYNPEVHHGCSLFLQLRKPWAKPNKSTLPASTPLRLTYVYPSLFLPMSFIKLISSSTQGQTKEEAKAAGDAAKSGYYDTKTAGERATGMGTEGTTETGRTL